MEEGSSRPDSGLPNLDQPGEQSQYPPRLEESERQSAMKGGRSRGSSGGILDDERGGQGAGYQKGPDAEAGKAMPRESGRV